jgi:Spy/CpxP family protein refolding chaperone
MKGIMTGRSMRRSALALAAVFFAGAALAGPYSGGPHRGPDPARMLDHMTAELDLTAEQREAVRETLESRREETRSLHEELRANHRELRNLDPEDPNYQTLANTLAQRRGELTSRMTLLRSQTHADIMALLDDEQQAKLAGMRAERMTQMAERRQFPGHKFGHKSGDRPQPRGQAPADGGEDGSEDESGATEEELL